MSSARGDTRSEILDAARELFEAKGYYGAGLEAVAKQAGVSRQAIYLHFDSKAELLTALHMHIFERDVAPALEHHDIWGAATALEGLDVYINVDAEIIPRICGIHDVLATARRHFPEVDETLRPREADRYADCVRMAKWLKKEGELAEGLRVADAADILWTLTSLPSYQNLVLERSWSHARWTRWVRDAVRSQLTR